MTRIFAFLNHRMIGWYHQLYGHEFEQTLGNNEGQQSLVC